MKKLFLEGVFLFSSRYPQIGSYFLNLLGFSSGYIQNNEPMFKNLGEYKKPFVIFSLSLSTLPFYTGAG